QWSFSAWVRPSSVPGGRRTIAGGMADLHDWGIALQDGQFGMPIRPLGGGFQTIRTGTPVVAGVWYQVVGTNDGRTARLYVDGQLRTSGAVDPGYLGTPSTVRIGGEKFFPGDNFPGLIDEVALYDRALSAQEVLAIFQTGDIRAAEPFGAAG